MKTIPELVSHFERRMKECDTEIERLTSKDQPMRTPEKEVDRWIAGWRNDRAVCRDTISYLKTLERREVTA